MVAGGERNDARGPARRVQQAEPVVGAAELNRPAALERLGFQQHFAAALLVEHGGAQYRRAMSDPVQPRRRGLDSLQRESFIRHGCLLASVPQCRFRLSGATPAAGGGRLTAKPVSATEGDRRYADTETNRGRQG